MKKIILLLLICCSAITSYGQLTYYFSCVGNSFLIRSPLPTGGTWSSAMTSIATVGSTSGIVTGVSVGGTTITYTFPPLSGYTFTVFNFIVNPSPSSIAGNTIVCIGNTSTLSDATVGGTWSSSNTTVAVVGSSSGIVTGISPGTTTISYTNSANCAATTVVSVMVSPGTFFSGGMQNLCLGNTITLSDAPSGGTWSSSATTIADIGSSSAIMTSVSPGTATISYTLSNGCFATGVVTITPSPTITSNVPICEGATAVLSDAIVSGTWSSANTTIADVGAISGIVTGNTAGTTTVTYILSSACYALSSITIHALPANISVGSTFDACSGNTLALSDATTGGAWSTGNSAVAVIGSTSGIVTGISAGTVTITYTLTTGCYVTSTVTVHQLPAPISVAPLLSMCPGDNIVISDVTLGGSWSSDNTTSVTIDPGSGLTTAISSGLATITYTMPTGCYVTTQVLVNANPAIISGNMPVCVSSSIALSDATTAGSWSSSNSSMASVNAISGVVAGINSGTASITYMLSTGCYDVSAVTINPLPSAITGPVAVCAGNIISLSDITPAGSWSSDNTTIATAGLSSGLVTGVNAGMVTISYELPTGCYTVFPLTVDLTPAAIAGNIPVCAGATMTLSNVTSGGMWSSANTTIMDVGSTSGIVTGNSAGTTTVTYILPSGCYDATVVTVNALPAPVTAGSLFTTCTGQPVMLSDATIGGLWSSGNTSIATVGSSTAIVTGIMPGTASVTYTLLSGCSTFQTITVLPLPEPITGIVPVCQGSVISLRSLSPDGIWSSSITTVATVVANAGIVTGASAGTSVISYTIPSGCFSEVTITVNPLPAFIKGPSTVCAGNKILLTSATPGGTWSSNNTSMVTISDKGVATGITINGANITYTLPSGCFVTHAVFVAPPCHVGIGQYLEKDNVEVYPNPAYNELIIKADAGSYNRFTITDALGREVMHSSITGEQTTVNIKQLAPGMYYLSLKGEKDMQVVKVVKQ